MLPPNRTTRARAASYAIASLTSHGGRFDGMIFAHAVPSHCHMNSSAKAGL